MQAGRSAPSRNRGQRLLLILAVLLGALLLLGLLRMGLGSGSPEFYGTTYLPPEPAADARLMDHTGEPRSLSDFRGQPVLLFFGYTHCPDICPITLHTLRTALDEIGDPAEEVVILLVTVDPERDTPEVLARYVSNFAPYTTGLTGSEDDLRALLSAYGVYAEQDQHEPGILAHTSAVFGIDSEGQIRVLLHADAPRDELERDLKTLAGL